MTVAMACAVVAAVSVLFGLWVMVRSSGEYEQGFQHGHDSHKAEFERELERVQHERCCAIALLAEEIVHKVQRGEMTAASAHLILMEGVERGYPTMLALYKAHERKAVPPVLKDSP